MIYSLPHQLASEMGGGGHTFYKGKIPTDVGFWFAIIIIPLTWAYTHSKTHLPHNELSFHTR